MVTPRIIRWTLVGLALATIAVCVVFTLRNRGPSLPRLLHYAGLPAKFGDALQRAHANLRDNDPDAVRALARLYQANRLYPESQACYRAIAAHGKGLSAQDHYYLAAIFLDEGDLGAAQAELKATIDAAPTYLPARTFLAEALFKTGEPDEAETEYEAILRAEPYNAPALVGLSRIKLQRGDDEGAVALLREAVAHHPDSISGASLLAQIQTRRGFADEAAAMTALSQQVHEPIPPDPWMKALLADCYDLQHLSLTFEAYRLTGQLDEALPLLGRLEELDPKGWMPRMMHGWSEREAGHYVQAVEQFQLALSDGGDPDKICPMLAATQILMGRPADAIPMLSKYHALRPNSMPILLSYSEVAVRLKDDILARKLLAEVLRTEPDLYMPNMSMVQILWKSGEKDTAAQMLQRVAKIFTSDIDSRGLLGQYYMEKSDPWSAVGPLEQAHALDSKNARLTAMLNTAYLAAGSMEASRGRLKEADTFADKAIRLIPDGLRGYALKANLCKHAKDFEHAAQAVGKMASIQPDNPAIRMSFGDLLYQSGDKDGARRQWEEALKLASGDATELRALLGRRLSGQITSSTFQ